MAKSKTPAVSKSAVSTPAVSTPAVGKSAANTPAVSAPAVSESAVGTSPLQLPPGVSVASPAEMPPAVPPGEADAAATSDSRERPARDAKPPTSRTPSPAHPITPASPSDSTTTVMVECPLGVAEGYAVRSFENLPRSAAVTLKKLASGLSREGLKLRSGRAITTGRDAIIYLCEQMEAGGEQSRH